MFHKPLSPAQQEYERYRNQKLSELLRFKDRFLEEKKDNIATKQELERLLAERSKPQPDYALKPRGYEQMKNLHQRTLEGKARVDELVKQLAPLQNRARDDFNMHADNFLYEKAKAERGMERD
ncbi:hypothetical protein MishRS11D_46440 (plasmid) [Methylomagnum ishizawai]|nr:hypothetical protein MishRS11D_46440 [Methylomagnum ishizawai]